VTQEQIVELLGGAGRWYVAAAAWQALKARVVAQIEGYHRRYPLRSGISREELRSRLKLAADAFDGVMAHLAANSVVAERNARVALPEWAPRLDARQQREVEHFLQQCHATPYSPPASELDEDVLAFLADQGSIVRVAPDIVFEQPAFDAMLRWIQDTVRSQGSVTVAQFRDRFGSSRKYALALLEYLDNQKVTLRVGDARVLYHSDDVS
jgi:selenocysteine-specific elongation factor